MSRNATSKAGKYLGYVSRWHVYQIDDAGGGPADPQGATPKGRLRTFENDFSEMDIQSSNLQLDPGKWQSLLLAPLH